VKADNVYTSPEYESAENRVELEIGLAIGNVSVHEVVP
jgi:predicted membrane protein